MIGTRKHPVLRSPFSRDRHRIYSQLGGEPEKKTSQRPRSDSERNDLDILHICNPPIRHRELRIQTNAINIRENTPLPTGSLRGSGTQLSQGTLVEADTIH